MNSDQAAGGNDYVLYPWAMRSQRGFDAQLGRGLAELHRFGAPRFGWERGNFIGTLPQRNQEQPLDVDLLIVDEMSMVDVVPGAAFQARAVLVAVLQELEQRPDRLVGDLRLSLPHRFRADDPQYG